MQQFLEDDPWYQQTEAVDDWRVTWAAADSQWWSSVHVYELVFVSEMDIFIIIFNFQTVYSVGGL